MVIQEDDPNLNSESQLRENEIFSGSKNPLVSISSTLFARFFRTNVILAAFFLRKYVCMYKKSCRNDIRTTKAHEKR